MAEKMDVALFGVISTVDEPVPRCAALIKDTVIELSKLWQLRYPTLEGVPAELDFVAIFQSPKLNQYAELPLSVRVTVQRFIVEDYSRESIPPSCIVLVGKVTMHLPMSIGNYVDFYCSLHHARNCAALVGGDVTDNFYTSPICYNGRASTIVPSPTKIQRPKGIFRDATTSQVIYGPSRKLDFELELGYFVSKPLSHGKILSIHEAPEYIFGFVLLNDWSARDVQAFELRPLGPFHSKGFGTSISSWIVPIDALNPFAACPKQDHQPHGLDHLRWNDSTTGTFDIALNASIIRNGHRKLIAKSNLRDLYWSPFQQLTHLASSGSGFVTGDLVGTGTISGSVPESQGCFFEASEDGTKPITLTESQTVTYLEDHDEVILEAWCVDGDGDILLNFAECRGEVLPAE